MRTVTTTQPGSAGAVAALNEEAASDAKPSPETVAKNWLSQNPLG